MGDTTEQTPTAGETRARARQALHGMNLLKAVAVTCGYLLIIQAFRAAALRLGVLCGGVEEVGADAFLARVAPGLPPESMDIARQIVVSFVGETVPVETWWHQAASSFLALMLDGALLAGIAVFMVSLMRGGGEIGQLFAGFRRFVRTGSLRVLMVLRITLWSLLLVVPGVLAFYSYRMAFFLMADDPSLSPSRALAESKRMMRGNRWRLMCLEASFIGWLLLVPLTMGLAAAFVAPYMMASFAAFYEDLLDRAEGAEEREGASA